MKNKSYYREYKKYYMALDCVIFGFTGENIEIVLIKRDFEPGFGDWALPGGFLDDNETLEQASIRVVNSLTGLHNVYTEQFYCFSEPNRDPGARIITVGFYAIIKMDEIDKEKIRKHNAYIFDIENIPDLMFDHNKIVEKAHEALKNKARNQPIGFELLPEKFTIPQFQKLYESIYQMPLDKRNFRKKIMSMDIIEKLDEKDKENSKRGAFLYSFNKKSYQKKIKKGFIFEI
jgi:8-oxo-dGTP diphosphatase